MKHSLTAFMRNALTTVSILILLSGCAGLPPTAPDKAFHTTTYPYPQLTGPRSTYGGWWTNRLETLNKVAEAGGFDVMLIGDSITHYIEGDAANKVFTAALKPAKIGNFGASADRTENVLWRLDHGNLHGKLNPKVVMVMIGTNNSGHRNDPPDEIAKGVEMIVSRVTSRFPHAQVLLLAIFPCGEKADNPVRINNEKANQLIAKLDGSAGGRVHYMDINAKFLKADGTLSKEIMPDLLHPNVKGYEIWAEAVSPEIKKLMKL